MAEAGLLVAASGPRGGAERTATNQRPAKRIRPLAELAAERAALGARPAREGPPDRTVELRRLARELAAARADLATTGRWR